MPITLCRLVGMGSNEEMDCDNIAIDIAIKPIVTKTYHMVFRSRAFINAA